MQIVGLTDIGNGRKVNEDDYFFTEEVVGDLPNILLVADGLGGHQAGEVASRLAIDSVVEYCLDRIERDLPKLLQDAFSYANQKVIEHAKSKAETLEMGTTLIALSILEKEYLIANVGDSRAYLFRDNELVKLTKDHSPVQELQELGIITEEEAYSHAHRNLITRAIGMEQNVLADTYHIPAKRGDIVLLCTDGLSNYMRRKEMAKVIEQENDLKKIAQNLVKGALDNEARDNITVLLVRNDRESEADQC